MRRPVRAAARLLCAAIALAGCAGAPGGALLVDPTLQAPAAPLPPLVDHAAGIELHSCADLLAALRAGKTLGEARESSAFNAYADCLAAALLAGARPAPHGSFDVTQAGERLYRDLDLASVASSLAPQRPAEHYRLQDLAFDAVHVTPRQVALQGNGFAYTFDVLALGDFRHAGRPELLVRFSDRSTAGGSYDQRAVLVVDTVPGSTALVATDALEILSASR